MSQNTNDTMGDTLVGATDETMGDTMVRSTFEDTSNSISTEDQVLGLWVISQIIPRKRMNGRKNPITVPSRLILMTLWMRDECGIKGIERR